MVFSFIRKITQEISLMIQDINVLFHNKMDIAIIDWMMIAYRLLWIAQIPTNINHLAIISQSQLVRTKTIVEI
jgi:hypothetical protein